MKHRIGIEPNLTQVKDLLSSKGYQVESVDTKNDTSVLSKKFDAIVVTGMNTNFLGINDTSTKAVVINAEGMTANEVYEELQSRLS